MHESPKNSTTPDQRVAEAARLANRAANVAGGLYTALIEAQSALTLAIAEWPGGPLAAPDWLHEANDRAVAVMATVEAMMRQGRRS